MNISTFKDVKEMSETASVSLTTIYTKIKEIENNQDLNVDNYIVIRSNKKYLTPLGQEYILNSLGIAPENDCEQVEDEEPAPNINEDKEDNTGEIKAHLEHIETLKDTIDLLKGQLQSQEQTIRDLTDIINKNINSLDNETYNRMLDKGIELKKISTQDIEDKDKDNVIIFEAGESESQKEDTPPVNNDKQTDKQKGLFNLVRNLFKK